MNLCEKCAADCRNKHAIEPGETVVHCGDYKPPMTNGDRLRAMSDEELAWELMLWRCEAVAKHNGIESQYPDTQSTILGWLQQPAEEATHENYT